MDKPFISIIIPAYNHELYIRDAVESVLTQNTVYSYEIIAGDDASTDNTAKVLNELAEQYPEKIKLVIQKNNKGVFNLVKKMYEIAKGDYIAVLDGDDKWINPEKLQKQVDFLEKHQDYVAVFHDAIIKSNISNKDMRDPIIREQAKTAYKFYSEKFNYPENYTVKDLILRKNIPSSSFLFRNIDLSEIFNTYENINLTFGWLIQLYVHKHGKFHYIPENWSEYNDHAEGITKKTGFNKFNKTNIKILLTIVDDSFYKNYKHSICASLSNQYKYLFFNNHEKGKVNHLMKHIYYYLKSILYSDK